MSKIKWFKYILAFLSTAMIFSSGTIAAATGKKNKESDQKLIQARKATRLKKIFEGFALTREQFVGLDGRINKLESIVTNLETKESSKLMPQVMWMLSIPGTGKTSVTTNSMYQTGLPYNRLKMVTLSDKSQGVSLDFSAIASAQTPNKFESPLLAFLFFDEILQLKPFKELTPNEAMVRAENFRLAYEILGSGRYNLDRGDFLKGVVARKGEQGNPYDKIRQLMNEFAEKYEETVLAGKYKRSYSISRGITGEYRQKGVKLERELVLQRKKIEQLEAGLMAREPKAMEIRLAKVQEAEAMLEKKAAYDQENSAWQIKKQNFINNVDKSEQFDLQAPKKFEWPKPGLGEKPLLANTKISEITLKYYDREYEKIADELDRVNTELKTNEQELSEYQSDKGELLHKIVNNLYDIRVYLAENSLPRKKWIHDFKDLTETLIEDDKRLALWLFSNFTKIENQLLVEQLPDTILLERKAVIICFAGNPTFIIDEAQKIFRNSPGPKTPNEYRRILQELTQNEDLLIEEISRHLGIHPEEVDRVLEKMEMDENIATEAKLKIRDSLRWLKNERGLQRRLGLNNLRFELPPTDEDYKKIVKSRIDSSIEQIVKDNETLGVSIQLTENFYQFIYQQAVDPVGAIDLTIKNTDQLLNNILSPITLELYKTAYSEEVKKTEVVKLDYDTIQINYDEKKNNNSNGNDRNRKFLIDFSFKKESAVLGKYEAVKTLETKVDGIAKVWEESKVHFVESGLYQKIYHQLGHYFGSMIEFGSFPSEALDIDDFDSRKYFLDSTRYEPNQRRGVDIVNQLSRIRSLLYGPIFEEYYDSLDQSTILGKSYLSKADNELVKSLITELVENAITADTPMGLGFESKGNLQRLFENVGLYKSSIELDAAAGDVDKLVEFIYRELLEQCKYLMKQIIPLVTHTFESVILAEDKTGELVIGRTQVLQFMEQKRNDETYVHHSFTPSFVGQVASLEPGRVGEIRNIGSQSRFVGECKKVFTEIVGPNTMNSISRFLDDIF